MHTMLAQTSHQDAFCHFAFTCFNFFQERATDREKERGMCLSILLMLIQNLFAFPRLAAGLALSGGEFYSVLISNTERKKKWKCSVYIQQPQLVIDWRFILR